MGNAIHKAYGGLRMVQVCRDWPKWFREYLSDARDDGADTYGAVPK